MTETRLAKALSYLFHPLFIPPYVLLLLLNLNSLLLFSIPFTYSLMLAGVVILVTVLFPLFMTWIFLRLGFISSVYLEKRDERVYPILAIAIFYYLAYYLLHSVRVSVIFSYYMLGATLLAVMALIINFFWKISLHMIAAGSFTGFFIGLSLKFGLNLYAEIIAGILIGGLTGFARLQPESHRPGEIYWGYLLGACMMTGFILLL